MNKLHITDERMLKLMAHAVIDMRIATSEWKYMEMIGIAPTNLSNIKQGRQRFSKDHIEKACEITGASADYIFGFTKNMMRKGSKDPIEMIKQAVMALEARKKASNSSSNKMIL